MILVVHLQKETGDWRLLGMRKDQKINDYKKYKLENISICLRLCRSSISNLRSLPLYSIFNLQSLCPLGIIGRITADARSASW